MGTALFARQKHLIGIRSCIYGKESFMRV